ncbi:MAG: FkbM family methyltransferase [Potamolinea sp.]
MSIINQVFPMIRNNEKIEKMLTYFCSNSFIKNNLKLRAIPIAHTYILDQPEIRIAQIGDFRFYVNIAEYSGVSLYFFCEHNEPFSAWLVSQLVNPGDVCIDIGANVGSYTFLMANSAGAEGQVFAFEPQPNLYNLLLDSVKMNQADGFISVDCRALYSHSGEILKFYLSENASNSGTSSLVNHGVFVREDHYISVETITMTDFFKIKSINKCKLVKIDVERAETEVLKGMVSLLKEKRIDYIILEQLAGSEAQQILSSANYDGWLIDEKQKILSDVNSVVADEFANYIFVSSNLINDFQQQYANFFK